MMADSRRTSIRVKLTLVYTAVFAGTSVLLMAGTFVVVRQTLVAEFHRLNQVDIKGEGGAELPAGKVVAIDRDGVAVTIGDLRSRISTDQADALETMTNHLLVTIVATAVAACILAMVVGWLMSGRVIRPLHQVVSTAETIAGSNLHLRIHMTGPKDELRRLADTFDAMLERLERSFDAQRRFIGNASHELRTPLAVSRSLIQVAMGRPGSSTDLRKLGADLLAVNTHQTALTNSLLVMARSEQEIRDLRLVDFDRVAKNVLENCLERAAHAHVDLVSELTAAQVLGDPVLLTHLIQNLIQNAIDYNHPGGEVHVTLSSSAGWCDLTISNTGPVIPPDDLATIFEPFRRLGSRLSTSASAPPGAGLGLSIAESLVAAHHGRITATARSRGGLTISAMLPIAHPGDRVDARSAE